MPQSFVNKLKSIDFYRKIEKDISKGTLVGSTISIVTAFVIVFLVGMELGA